MDPLTHSPTVATIEHSEIFGTMSEETSSKSCGKRKAACFVALRPAHGDIWPKKPQCHDVNIEPWGIKIAV